MLVVCSLERILAKSAKAFYSLASNKYTMDLEDRFAAWVLCSRNSPRHTNHRLWPTEDDPNIVVLEHYFTWIRVHAGMRMTNEGVEDFGE